MKYEVVRDFVDVQDGNYMYRAGDFFPRNGADVSEERIAELASTENRCGIVLIEPLEIETEKDAEISTEETIADSEEEVKTKPKKK